MNTNSEYIIKNVAISTNGIDELYLDVEWEGDETIDFYELTLEEFRSKGHQIIKDEYKRLGWG